MSVLAPDRDNAADSNCVAREESELAIPLPRPRELVNTWNMVYPHNSRRMMLSPIVTSPGEAEGLVAATDISGLNGHFAAQQVWAAVLLAAFFLLILIGLRIVSWTGSKSQVDDSASESPARITIGWGRLSSLVGLDNRVSTSRTIALLWTIVIGYCLLALVLIATASHSSATPTPPGHIPDGFIEAALKPLAPAYIVLLGAPFAAAAGASAIVGQRVKNNRLQKSKSMSRPNPLQVV